MKGLDRLSVKLSLAFAGVAILGVLSVSLLAGFTTRSNFDWYLDHVEAMNSMMGGGMGGMGMGGAGSPRDQFLDRQRSALVLGGLAAAGLAGAAGIALARRLSRPLDQMAVAAQRLAAGDLGQRVPAAGSDEIGQLGRAFNSMAASLEAAEHERRRFVADVAHELRTPLTVLQSHLEAIQDGLMAPDHEQVSLLHEETAHLSRLVEDLRTLSLDETGRLDMRREALDLPGLARNLLRDVEPVAAQRRVRLRLEAEDAMPAASGDPVRLREVLHNLLSNALRVAPADSEITVGVQHQGESVVASVADRGPGVAAADMARLFDPAHRRRRPSDGTGGSGLGLVIARRLVEAHGGRIWAENRADGGFRVSFALPLGKAPDPTAVHTP